MADNRQRYTGRDQNYKFDRGGMSANWGPFVGVVKNNIDPTRQGRLQVYIEQFGGINPNDKGLWRTVRYCPPYYGLTPQARGGNTAEIGTYEGSNPQSYGMWFTPPDLEVNVLCFFVGGDPNKGYYTGCLPDPGINQMIPAIGAVAEYNTNSADQKSYYNGAKVLPVTELNTNNQSAENNPKFFDQKKPVHSFVAGLMFQQGTLGDTDRGPISSSSQRESPSASYGMITPGRAIYSGGLTEKDTKQKVDAGTIKPQDVRVVGRRGGHSLVLDDGDINGKNNLVRIRTALGHQITMSDDGNFFYFIHANGQTWIELGQEGTVDVYATNSVNVRTEGTINMHADKDINMFAGRNINIKSKENTTIETDKSIILNSNEDMTIYGRAKIGVLANGSLAMVSNNGSWNGNGSLVFQAGGIDLNGGSAEGVDPAQELQRYIMPDTTYDSSTGWNVQAGALESIVTRAPTHEPWPYHNKGVDAKVAMEEGQPGTPPNTPPIPNGWQGTVN